MQAALVSISKAQRSALTGQYRACLVRAAREAHEAALISAETGRDGTKARRAYFAALRAAHTQLPRPIQHSIKEPGEPEALAGPYELERQRNIEQNNQVLRSLGLA